MKALILAAGYGTRLYPLTKNLAKPLIKIGDKTILEHIVKKIEEVEEVNEISIISNNHFYNQFLSWKGNNYSCKKITIINDGTKNKDERLGAIGTIDYYIKKTKINEDLLIIAGDNLFGFSLKDLILDYKQKKKISTVAFYDLKSKEKVKEKYGVGIVDQTNKLIGFEEKPTNPSTSLASTACYLINYKDLHHVEKIIKDGRGDNLGDLIKSLCDHSNVNAFIFDEHWFDIGSFESLDEAREIY